MKLVTATMKYLAVSALLPKFLSPLTASVFGNNPPNAPCSIFFGTKNKKLNKGNNFSYHAKTENQSESFQLN